MRHFAELFGEDLRWGQWDSCTTWITTGPRHCHKTEIFGMDQVCQDDRDHGYEICRYELPLMEDPTPLMNSRA